MGGLSARELMQGPTVPRKGDFVDNCLENLSANYKGEREENITIVGTNLHGPTFDENFDQDPTEVSFFVRFITSSSPCSAN